jgi:hypothetical protein
MSALHLPSLAAIKGVDDLEVRFYAMIGACISLVAAVEHDLFDLYVDASGFSALEAAPVFYRYVKFSHKRDTADGAITAALAGHSLLKKWESLLEDVQALVGDGAPRNLLGHNGVSTDLFVQAAPDGESADVFERFTVNQNANIVLAGMRPARTETISTLEIYAQRLITLRLRLTRFAAPLRQACGRSR